MKTKFSREPFNGISNKKINTLNIKSEKLRHVYHAKQAEIYTKIKEIQTKCNHTYKLYTTGPYDDTYKCIHCGLESIS
jgi:hypothetical protein